jgi:outer membrane biosynthesis protein TonB
LTGEEALGLAVAIAAHAALIAALTLSPLGRKVQPPPQRMTVSLADAVSDQSTSPKPDAQAAPDQAPDLGEPDHADQPLPPAPQPVAKPEPAPKPKPVAKPEPKPAPKPEPKPATKPKPEPKPAAKPEPKPTPKPAAKAKAEPKPQDKPAGGDTRAHPHPAKPAGGSRINQDFLAGIPGSTTPGTDKVSPGAKLAAVSAADVRSAISRQIKPHWIAPQGVDVEKLVTVIAFTLNPDGTLASRPTLLSQTGFTDANRAQRQRHIELAIRAVQLAAPFKLPPQAYAQFSQFQCRFDRTLSQ